MNVFACIVCSIDVVCSITLNRFLNLVGEYLGFILKNNNIELAGKSLAC